MKRIAVFVEGRTELNFIHRLVHELAGRNNVSVKALQIVGGKTVPRQTILLHASSANGGEKFYVLIYDCGGDHQVKTRIMEEHAGLTSQGYSQIIGIRDVRPDFKLADIPRLEAGLKSYISSKLAPVTFILSVMEVEAWFLAEFSHFPRIDAAITVEQIRADLGFDPTVGDLADREMPAIDLDSCYKLAGHGYQKGAQRTIDVLDFAEIFINLPARIPYLAKLVDTLDDFFRPPKDALAGG